MFRRVNRGLLTLGIFFAFITNHSWGDAPRLAPQDRKVFSPNHRFYALSSLKEAKTQVFASSNRQKVLWEIPGWHPIFFVADDGKHLVVGYDGSSILDDPINVREPFLRFYTSSSLVQEIKIGEFFPNLKALPETTSGRAWGDFIGFDEKNHFVVRLSDGKLITFNPDNGQIIGH